MPALPPDALMAALQSVHKTGVQTDPQTGMPYDAAQAGGADPNADPNAQGGQDPTEQAIWDRFPGTDPQQVQQAAGSGGPEALAAILQQQEQDRQHLEELHMNAVQQLASMLMPEGGGQPAAGGGAPPMSPGTGGEGSGY